MQLLHIDRRLHRHGGDGDTWRQEPVGGAAKITLMMQYRTTQATAKLSKNKTLRPEPRMIGTGRDGGRRATRKDGPLRIGAAL